MDREDRRSFSRRHGYTSRAREITVRNDAPEACRTALLQVAKEVGLVPSDLREVICNTLHQLPDRNNWSEYPNIWEEVQDIIHDCEWFRVYDIAEALYRHLASSSHLRDTVVEYEGLLNEYFRESGIGWQMTHGKIIARGPEAFESAIHQAVDILKESGRYTASNEIHEAICDISRRPNPDLTGAIHHGMAALECVARDICGDPKATLGDLLKRYPDRLKLPKPLDEVVTKAWGYASEMARHVREGRTPDHDEADLMVGLAATVATYLSRKRPTDTMYPSRQRPSLD